jgi:hypothetical protein
MVKRRPKKIRWSCYGTQRRRRPVPLGYVIQPNRSLAQQCAFHRWPEWTFHVLAVPSREDDGPLGTRAKR